MYKIQNTTSGNFSLTLEKGSITLVPGGAFDLELSASRKWLSENSDIKRLIDAGHLVLLHDSEVGVGKHAISPDPTTPAPVAKVPAVAPVVPIAAAPAPVTPPVVHTAPKQDPKTPVVIDLRGTPSAKPAVTQTQAKPVTAPDSKKPTVGQPKKNVQ